MKKIGWFVVFLMLVTGCGGHVTDYVVDVSRSSYQPQIDAAKYSAFKGKTVSFYSIDVQANNVANFAYYSDDGKVGYRLYYEKGKLNQPVASYFWYTLEKSLQHVGMNVTPDGPLKDVPEMILTITSLTDSKAVLRMKLNKNVALLFEKNLTVALRQPPTADIDELEKRSYQFMDTLTEKILSDEDFKKAF